MQGQRQFRERLTALFLQVWLEHVSQAFPLFTAWSRTFSYLKHETLFNCRDAEKVTVNNVAVVV